VTAAEIERIARLEVRLDTLIEQNRTDREQIAELLAIMNQAKGARWAILGVVGIASTITTLLVQWGLKGA
jgi:hypothetical protein